MKSLLLVICWCCCMLAVSAQPELVGMSVKPDDIDTLLDTLAWPDIAMRLDAVQKLGKQHEPLAVPGLIDCLQDAAIRLAAIEAMGEIGDARAVEPLIKLLPTATPEIKRQLAQALGKIDDPRSVTALLELMADADHDTRIHAISGLAYQQDPRVLPALIAALRDPDLRPAIASSLRAFADPAATQALIGLLADQDWVTRLSAASTLGPRHAPEALLPLLASTRDANAEVRASAAWALSRYRDPRVTETLLPLLNDPDNHVLTAACDAFGRLGDRQAVEPLIAKLQDPRCQGEAIQALGSLRDPRAVAPLLEMVKAGTQAGAVLEALGHIGDPIAGAPLYALRDQVKEEQRYQWQQALQELPDPRLVEPLLLRFAEGTHEECMENGFDDQCIAALYVLVRVGEPAMRTVLAWLRDTDPRRRLAAARELMVLPDARAVPALIPLLHDANRDLQRAAILALGSTRDRRAVEPLLALLPDADLRGFALQALSVIGDRRSNTAMLAMLQDENATVRAHAVLALLNSEDPGGVGKALEAIPALEVDINEQITETVQRAGPQLADGLLVALNGDEQTRKMAFTMLIVMALDQHGEPLPAMPFGLGTAVEPLLRFADDPVDPVRVNALTLLALAREPRALPVFRGALAAPVPDAKNMALFGLSRIGEPAEVVQRASELLQEKDLTTRWMALLALERLAELPPADPERRRAADLLLPMLQEPNLSVRSLAINRLGLTGDPRALNALLPVARLRNSDLACMAIRVLGQFTDPRATEALYHALRVNRGSELMLNALPSALADSADPRAHEALLTVIDDPALPSEENALNALIRAAHPRIVEQIITWLSPEYDAGDNRLGADDYVELITALGETGDPRAVEPLVAQLTAQELRRRPAAARSLGRLQDPRAVPALIVALQDPSRTFEDSDEDVATRRDAALALGDIGDARAVEPLIAMLEIGDMDARGAAAQSLGRLKDARAVAPLILALDRLSGSPYRAACASLQQLTGHDFGDDAARWQAWNAEHAPL